MAPVVMALVVVAPVIVARRLWRAVLLRAGRFLLGLAGHAHELFQFTAIQPDTPAGRAHVELHAGALHRLHRGLAVRTHHQRHA